MNLSADRAEGHRAGGVASAVRILEVGEGGERKGRRVDSDGVGSGTESIENVVAVGIGVCLSTIVEVDEHVGEALACVEDSIAVHVPIDEVADAGALEHRDVLNIARGIGAPAV